MAETQRIDGKASADRLVGRIAAAAADLKAETGVVAGLCAVLVGDDPASQIYVRSKGKAAVAAGIESFTESLPASTSEADLLALSIASTATTGWTASWCNCRCPSTSIHSVLLRR